MIGRICSHHRMEFPRTTVAFIMFDMVGKAEIQRGIGICCRNDIPSRPAVADMIQ